MLCAMYTPSARYANTAPIYITSILSEPTIVHRLRGMWDSRVADCVKYSFLTYVFTPVSKYILTVSI